MLKMFLPLVASSALLALASAASAAQPLSDAQMDAVNAGAAAGVATAAAVAFGEFQADTTTTTLTNVVQGLDMNPLTWFAVGQSQSVAAASGGALFQTAVAVQSQSAATL